MRTKFDENSTAEVVIAGAELCQEPGCQSAWTTNCNGRFCREHLKKNEHKGVPMPARLKAKHGLPKPTSATLSSSHAGCE